MMPRLLPPLLSLFVFACSTSPHAGADQGSADAGLDTMSSSGGVCAEGPGEVFEQRIRPLIENDRPSSCSKCHIAGVNLGAFVTGDACGSMQCLVTQGLVDLDTPTESQLLTFISRGYNAEEGTGVTNAMVREEYTGVLEWIEWAAECMESTCPDSRTCNAPPPTPLADAGMDEDAGPPPPELNLANYPCGEAHQVRAFYDHAYPPEGRCGHCHAPSGAIAGIGDAPLWMARTWTLAGARTTIENLHTIGAVNLEHPRKSTVLLKPLNPEYGGIEHGGGSKFANTDDPLYVALLTWIKMQRECRRTNDLPEPKELDDDSKY